MEITTNMSKTFLQRTTPFTPLKTHIGRQVSGVVPYTILARPEFQCSRSGAFHCVPHHTAGIGGRVGTLQKSVLRTRGGVGWAILPVVSQF